MNFAFRVNLILIYVSISAVVLAQVDGIVARLKYESTRTCSSDSGITNLTYYIRPDILRLDMNGPYVNSTTIFQPSSEKVWVLYHHEGVYYVMNPQDIEHADGQVEALAEEMKRSYEAMDEKDKESASAIWPMGNPFLLDEPEYEKVRGKDSLINQLKCKHYTGITEANYKKDAYVNNFKGLGIKDEEMKILTLFYRFMGKASRTLSGSMDFTSFRKWEIKAYPVLITQSRGNNVCNLIILQNISKQKLEDKLFTIPISYSKMENPLGKIR